jgi:hypothetical protein
LIYFVGATYPVTRAVIPDAGDVFVQVIVGSPFPFGRVAGRDPAHPEPIGSLADHLYIWA